MFSRKRWFAATTGIILTLAAVTWAADAPATAPATVPVAAKNPADQPAPKMDKTDPTKMQAQFAQLHAEYVAKAKKGDIDVYFEGDSITHNWGGPGKEIWAKEFAGWKAANFGIGGDRTEHVLWRMENGELDGVHAKAVVLMIGTNNSGNCSAEEIAGGVKAIVARFREKQPAAKILVLAIFPRGDVPEDNPPDKKRAVVLATNKILAATDFGPQVKFLNINDKFPAVGTPEFEKVFPDKTHLHPGAEGYQIWADAIKPILKEWGCGPAQ